MRHLLLRVLVCPALLASPALAGGFTNGITDTVNLQVQGGALMMERIGSSYSASGSNVTIGGASATMGLTGGTATDAATAIDPTFVPTTGAQSWSFSESLTVGDDLATPGAAGSAPSALYGNNTTQYVGIAGTLAGSVNTATGAMTITAGGAGTTATAQRSVLLTVFD